ncbi:hypothetical protein N8T08_008120 [Aspergillus melleus]|uniref:Uncharacterized protein n=1 Tax=Aspergillus melleus TaxID=138277 RepID=A0ACC3AWY9_9EURO|nr:hypothetical protein N8T08_008120 [Aspergillus melleus]
MSDKEVLPGLPECWTPDIVVGIDFGMTYTGVAYSCGPEWAPPKTIQRWPGRLLSELANKVPTSLEYCSESNQLRNWGFKCDPEAKGSDIKEFFKLHLAPQSHEEFRGGSTRQEAQRWFQDFILCIYQHVVSIFNDTIPHFDSRHVEFSFSVPTTWKDVRMVQETREILERVINTKTPRHRAFIGLTEAEAAAVYAGNEHYLVDDTILTYLVLSGEFGSSPYVRQRLEENFGNSAIKKCPNAKDMQILVADEPL